MNCERAHSLQPEVDQCHCHLGRPGRRFLDLELDRYTVEKIVEATTLPARTLKLPPRCVMLLA